MLFRRMLALGCVLGAGLLAQTPAAPAEDKPDPRAKARDLLDRTLDIAPTTTPGVHATALYRIAQDYSSFNKKKSLDLLDRAFQAAGAIPPGEPGNPGDDVREQVVAEAARVDVELALKMLGDFPSPPPRAVEAVINALIAKERLPRAIDVLERFGMPGSFPFRAATSILDKLPAGDDRRVLFFSNATTAYAAHPDTDYIRLVTRHWKTVPRPIAEQAVKALVEAILTRTEEEGITTQTLASAKGSASFDNAKDAELFDILGILRQIDPKRVEEILDKRPKLKEALEKFPDGSASLADEKGQGLSASMNRNVGGGNANPQQEAAMRANALANNIAMEAINLASKEPDKALEKAKEIPILPMRLHALAEIALAAASKSPSTTTSVLNALLPQMKDMKEPQFRCGIWPIIAEAAFKTGDNDRAREAIDKAMEDAATLYKNDTNADDPNTASRVNWPSVQMYRSISYRAAKMFGADAELLLQKVQDPDLQVLARIEIAGALLGREMGPIMMSISRGRPK